jgi:hypothetical protein
MTDSTDSSQGEIEVEAVEDPESYIQSRRLRDIFEARKTVRKQRQTAKQYQVNNSGIEATLKAQRYYRASVENYLTELRPLFLSDDRGKRYWYKLDLGSIRVEPIISEKTVGRGSPSRVIKKNGSTYYVKEEVEAEKIDLTGLGCLFSLADPIVCDFELMVERVGLGGGLSSKVVTETRNIPFTTLDSIMNQANMYLQERGIELDPEEEEDPANLSL